MLPFASLAVMCSCGLESLTLPTPSQPLFDRVVTDTLVSVAVWLGLPVGGNASWISEIRTAVTYHERDDQHIELDGLVT